MMTYTKKKKINSGLIAVLITALLLSFFTWQQESSETAAATKDLTNLVIFVDFKDTVHNHISHAWGEGCFIEHPGTNTLFNGTASPFTLQNYLSKISYGALNVESVFPQLNTVSGKVVPLKLTGTTAYYAGNYMDNLQGLVQDVVSGLQKLNLSGYNLDKNNDGIIDNLMIIVPCENTSTSTQSNSDSSFWGVASSYFGTDKVAGKSVGTFTVLTEAELYFSLGQSGTIAHEFLHTQGFPDLYRSRGTTNSKPVGRWDIMSSCSYCLQFPLAYTRMNVGGWISIPTVTTSQNYSLYSATATLSDASLKNKQAVILKTPYSDSEFFVLEYRQKATSSKDYEYPIEGSGLIIYRVNESLIYKKNTTDDPYYIYIFRPGDTLSNGIEKGEGDMTKSFLSSESGRTSYGTADLKKGLADGAITYSDGTNSGIVISDVGSANGSSISFKITFTEMDAWEIGYSEKIDSAQIFSACQATDGSAYYLINDAAGCNLYKSAGNSITKICAAPSDSYQIKLTYYGGKLYCIYYDYYTGCLKARSLNGTSWSKELFSISEEVESFDAFGYENSLYLAYSVSPFKSGSYKPNQICAAVYDGNKITQLGANVGSSLPWGANPLLCVNETNLIVAYKEVSNNSALIIKKYDKNSNSWKLLSDSKLYYSGTSLQLSGERLYFVASASATGAPGLYACDLNKATTEYTVLVSQIVSGEGIYDSDIKIAEGTPYVLYMGDTSKKLECAKYANNALQKLGKTISTETNSFSGLIVNNGKLQVMCSNSAGYIALKTKAITSPKPTNTPVPTATPKPTNTPIPTATPSAVPTATSTPKPTATSTPKPTATSTPKPTATATPKPTATSTPKPTATSTPKPTATSTPKPTATSTPKPTATSTPKPTATATPKPTATATPKPTATATPKPATPTELPLTPTATPSAVPTATAMPSVAPVTPTEKPVISVTPSVSKPASQTPIPTGEVKPSLEATNTPIPTLTNSPSPSLSPTPLPATPTELPLTPTATLTVEPTKPTETPVISTTPKPTNTLIPTATPTAEPAATEGPIATDKPIVTPEITALPETTVTPKPATESSRVELIFVTCLVIGVGVTAIVCVFVFRRRKK